MVEIKIGRYVAFTNYQGKYNGHRIGKVIKATNRHLTIKLSNGIKKRIPRTNVYGIVWFKKIRPLEEKTKCTNTKTKTEHTS